DLRVHRLDVKAVAATIRRPFETSVEADIDLIVERLQLAGRARARARKAMMAERLKTARFRGCWLVRLPPSASIRDTSPENRLGLRLSMLVGSYVAQYVLFGCSLWVVCRSIPR